MGFDQFRGVRDDCHWEYGIDPGEGNGYVPAGLLNIGSMLKPSLRGRGCPGN